MNYTGINLQTLQDKRLILVLENIIRGGISIVLGVRYVKTDGKEKQLYTDATILYDWVVSNFLPDGNINFDKNNSLDDF